MHCVTLRKGSRMMLHEFQEWVKKRRYNLSIVSRGTHLWSQEFPGETSDHPETAMLRGSSDNMERPHVGGPKEQPSWGLSIRHHIWDEAAPSLPSTRAFRFSRLRVLAPWSRDKPLLPVSCPENLGAQSNICGYTSPLGVASHAATIMEQHSSISFPTFR